MKFCRPISGPRRAISRLLGDTPYGRIRNALPAVPQIPVASTFRINASDAREHRTRYEAIVNASRSDEPSRLRREPPLLAQTLVEHPFGHVYRRRGDVAVTASINLSATTSGLSAVFITSWTSAFAPARAEAYASSVRSGGTMFCSKDVRVYAGSSKQTRMPKVRTS